MTSPKRASNIYRAKEIARQTDKNRAQYRKKRAQLLKQQELICHLCGKTIDKNLKYPHPQSFTADHIQPVSKTGTLMGEIKAAHNSCNAKRKDGAVPNWRINVREW